MLANPLRTKRKSASAQRYLRALGATIDMANLIMRPAKSSNQRRIVAWMFTKSQLGGRRGYWVWSPSGNCWCFYTRSPAPLLTRMTTPRPSQASFIRFPGSSESERFGDKILARIIHEGQTRSWDSLHNVL